MTNKKIKIIDMLFQDECERRILRNTVMEKFSKLDAHKTKIVVQFMRDNNMGKNKKTLH